MTTLTTIATAVPPYSFEQEQAKRVLQQIFRLDSRKQAAMAAIFDNALVNRRYSVLPLEDVVQLQDLGKSNQLYQEYSIALGRQAAASCLEQAGVEPHEIDILVSVSCTGYIVPSLDAYLIEELGFRPDVRRLPITELGCVGGAGALARAQDLVRALPGAKALVIAVELPTLTFQHSDTSLDNLIACALFGDGAAAALIAPDDRPGAQILATRSCLLPGTLNAMGFDLRDSGFHMVLAKSVPQLLRDGLAEPIEQLLAPHGLALDELDVLALHPGGKRILEQLEDTLHIPRHKTQPSWDVLRDYGNLSSATLLFVLQEWLSRRKPAAGTYGLAAGFGPGLSAELLLLRWA